MIQLFGISKEYQRGSPVLNDVSLHIEKGEFVYLTGPSGTGKTTLLRLIFCAEPPSKGRIVLMRKNVAKIQTSSIPYIRRNIGVVFQDYKLLTNQTVFHNVALALEVLGTQPRVIRKKVSDILRGVGLYEKRDRYPLQLSGGEQQRVSIARALVNEPSILLADEPTGNLDDDNTTGIMELFAQANARGTTILMATHDRSLFRATSRRVLHLAGGRIVFDSHATESPVENEATSEEATVQETISTNPPAKSKPLGAGRLPFMVRAKQESLPLTQPRLAEEDAEPEQDEENLAQGATPSVSIHDEDAPSWARLKPDTLTEAKAPRTSKKKSSLTGDLFSRVGETPSQEDNQPMMDAPSRSTRDLAFPPFDGKLGQSRTLRKGPENFQETMRKLSKVIGPRQTAPADDSEETPSDKTHKPKPVKDR